MTHFSRDKDPQVGPPVERSGSQDWPETRSTRVKRMARCNRQVHE